MKFILFPFKLIALMIILIMVTIGLVIVTVLGIFTFRFELPLQYAHSAYPAVINGIFQD